MSATDAFRAARDQLLAQRERRDQAVAQFAFPDVGDRWYWAVDWLKRKPERARYSFEPSISDTAVEKVRRILRRVSA